MEAILQLVVGADGEIGLPGPETDDRDPQLVAEMAIADPTASGNPRPLDVPTAKRLFVSAVRGELEEVR